MTHHWTFIHNELMQTCSCPIGPWHNFLESSSALSWCTWCTGSSDICKNGWYFTLRPMMRQSVS